MHSLPSSPRPLLLCLLSGLPASGKSSLALALRNIIRHRAAWECALICYDDIITPDAFQRETSPTTGLEPAEGVSLMKEKLGLPTVKGLTRFQGEELAYITGKVSEIIKGKELESLDEEGPVWVKQEETDSLKEEEFERLKRLEPRRSKGDGRLKLTWGNPGNITSEESVKLKGNATDRLKRVGQVYLIGQECGHLKNTGTALQEDGGTCAVQHLQGISAAVLGETVEEERQKDLRPGVTVHPEALDCANKQLQSQTTDAWISNWKQYRQELLLYVDCFLASVATGAPLSATKEHTESLWSRFICCLDSQGLFSCRATEAGSPCDLKLKESSIPLCIVMDDNFYYQSMRYQVYQLARKHSAGFCQLFLDCGVEFCLERNRQRNSSLPDEIIHLMSGKLERPNPDKNPWEQKSLILDMSQCTWDRPRVMDLLQLALETPVKYHPEDTEQKDVDRAISASNFLHQADQAFRRIVSQTMQKAQGKVAPKEKKVLAKELHRLKGDFLEELRQKGVIGPCSSLHLDDSLLKIISVFQSRTDSTLLQHTKLAMEIPKH